MWSTGRSNLAAEEAALPLPLEIRPMRSARGLKLRIDESRRVLKLTCPARMSRKAALRWVGEQRQWIDRQLASLRPGEPLVPGAVIPVEGREVELCWSSALPRTPVLDGDRLSCGGPRDAFAGRVLRFLRRRALDTLSAETLEIAANAGLRVASINIGDAATRWGSCSSDGRIRYSWRLILAPPEARRYVVAHEVAHLAHLNHGAAFKALEAELLGADPAPAKAILKTVGARLKRVGLVG